jgi:hypothetical protein
MSAPPSSAIKASLLMFIRSSPQVRDIPDPRRPIFESAYLTRVPPERQPSESK